jgi:hypothetical protein
MEPSFDLDINNYVTEDLIKFFRLEQNFSLEDLFQKEIEISTEILSVSNTKYNPKYKFDIISFIKSAKEVLTIFYNDMESTKEINKNIARFIGAGKDSRVGKIINPLSSHQSLEQSIIPNCEINGYSYETTTSIFVFNTAARNDYYNTIPSNSTYDLPIKWKDIISVSLASANIPNVMYAYNSDSATNQIYIEEDGTGLSAVVTLPEGNYTPYKAGALIVEASFPDVLTLILNEQVLGITNPALYRFGVDIDLANRKTTIYNTTNTFIMKVLIRDPVDRCSQYSNTIYTNYQNYPTNKSQVPLYTYLQTMGYLMGFREIEYFGKKSYTSESIFTNVYSNYLYFVLDDYTGSQAVTNTYGVLGEFGMLDSNILGVIPINSNLFSTTFDNNSNFIYKKREYFGPVDISRISIKLLNQRGNLVNFHGADFNFSLQVKTIYNLSQKTKMNIRRPGPF